MKELMFIRSCKMHTSITQRLLESLTVNGVTVTISAVQGYGPGNMFFNVIFPKRDITLNSINEWLTPALSLRLVKDVKTYPDFILESVSRIERGKILTWLLDPNTGKAVDTIYEDVYTREITSQSGKKYIKTSLHTMTAVEEEDTSYVVKATFYYENDSTQDLMVTVDRHPTEEEVDQLLLCKCEKDLRSSSGLASYFRHFLFYHSKFQHIAVEIYSNKLMNEGV